jgi:hypothetical protein
MHDLVAVPRLVPQGDEDGGTDGAAWHSPPAAPATTPTAPAASARAAPGEVLMDALVELVVIVLVAVSPVVFVLLCHLKLLDLS